MKDLNLVGASKIYIVKGKKIEMIKLSPSLLTSGEI